MDVILFRTLGLLVVAIFVAMIARRIHGRTRHHRHRSCLGPDRNRSRTHARFHIRHNSSTLAVRGGALHPLEGAAARRLARTGARDIGRDYLGLGLGSRCRSRFALAVFFRPRLRCSDRCDRSGRCHRNVQRDRR